MIASIQEYIHTCTKYNIAKIIQYVLYYKVKGKVAQNSWLLYNQTPALLDWPSREYPA